MLRNQPKSNVFCKLEFNRDSNERPFLQVFQCDRDGGHNASATRAGCMVHQLECWMNVTTV
jgi:hypothetical protein